VRVIDSSSLVKYFSREENWELVKQYILEGIITIDLAIKELGNALWKKVLRGELPLEVAKAILEDLAENKVLKLVDQGKYLVKAFEIAVNHKITVYDALFVAVAFKENLELITSDSKQREVAEEYGIKTIYIP